jgi:hypothetical protein
VSGAGADRAPADPACHLDEHPQADDGLVPADLLRRGRPLLLQGAASTLADRLGAALAVRADTAGDGRFRAALDEIRVGAVVDSAGTISRLGDE